MEKKSEELRDKIGLRFGPGIGSTEIKFTSYLKSEHNIEVKIIPPEEDQKSVKKFDINKNILYLSEMLTYTARNFHLAYQIAFTDGYELIVKIVPVSKLLSSTILYNPPTIWSSSTSIHGSLQRPFPTPGNCKYHS